jgi:hypothetical protein
MRRSFRPGPFSIVLLALLINGCGAGNRPSTTSRSPVPPASAHTTTAGAPGTSPAAAPTQAPGAAHQSATPPASNRTTTTATNVRLPARFEITGHATLSPSTVAAPAGVTIELTLSSGDGRPHQVRLRTAPPHSLSVPAGGRASLALTGLKDGSYELDVDGARAGALIVGAQPGP